MKHTRVVTNTLHSEFGNYAEDYSCSWDEDKSWARFAGPEFQFTISREGVAQLKELVDAFMEFEG
jgi:hypothetical protein